MKINPEKTYYIGWYNIQSFTGKELIENIKEVKGSVLEGWWDDAKETKIEALKALIKVIRKETKRLEAKNENT